MAKQPRSSSRRQKIEPLDYAEAALAPALKGMTSFLDLSPEAVRSGNFTGLTLDTTVPALYGASGVVSSPEDGTKGMAGVDSKRLAGTHIPSTPGAVSVVSIDSYPDHVLGNGYSTTPGYVSALDASAEDTDNLLFSSVHLMPGRGRSGVRRCLLAKDGHSLGEEAIYQLLWKSGTSESTEQNGSRTVRLGAAEIGLSVNMAKKNVRQNIARLFEKLAIEIVEDFGTINSQARLYRVFSSMQILERRRAAGMEYVLRNKGVIFCERNGTATKASPAYVVSPGEVGRLRPARPKRRRPRQSMDRTSYYPEITVLGSPAADGGDEVSLVAEALNRYWTVSKETAAQLVRACRRICADARAEEIAFFIHEKLELAGNSRNVNPVDLILVTVPQAFAGSSFVEFRHRMEQRTMLAAGEAERKRRNTAELGAWMRIEREKLIAAASDASLPDDVRNTAERKLRQYNWKV